MATKKYIPKPEGLPLELHRVCVETGVLHIQRCQDCGQLRHPPRWYCPHCHSKQYELAPVSGEGTIYSTVINHYTVDLGWADEVPYTSAVVELAEGPRVIGHLRGVEPGGARLGSAVRVVVEPRGQDFAFLSVEMLPEP
ncbi:MAG: Zn-ribbon domain-containing OB-fold protein [Acidimicrobiia bacterium]|nr:Zn-ribbon domain-containing OB-fold protein [Acidimicrobiia bacterium]